MSERENPTRWRSLSIPQKLFATFSAISVIVTVVAAIWIIVIGVKALI